VVERERGKQKVKRKKRKGKIVKEIVKKGGEERGGVNR
jgi:hypothetical protein